MSVLKIHWIFPLSQLFYLIGKKINNVKMCKGSSVYKIHLLLLVALDWEFGQGAVAEKSITARLGPTH